LPVFLCIPPVSSLVPYPAIPYLTSSLRANNQKVSTFDLNIKAFNLTLFHQRIDIKPGEILSKSNNTERAKWKRVPKAEIYSTMRDGQRIFEEIMLKEAYDQLGYNVSNLIFKDIISEESKQATLSDVWKICNDWFLEVAHDSKEQNIVGFHVISHTGLMWSLLLACKLKKIQPRILTVLGGPAFLSAQEVLSGNSEIDVIVRGEGEVTISEIANSYDGSLESIKGIDGISYRTGKNGIVSNADRQLIKSLDALPFPDYDDLPLHEYPQNKFGMPVMPVVGSRGCIGDCVFCVEKRLWGNTYRMRSPENIVSEIKNIKEKYGTSIIRFNDSSINCNIKSLEKFCDLLIEENIGMQWTSNARIRPEMNNKLLRKMRQAGCMGLWFGIESGSQRILRKMKKGYDLETAKNVIHDTAKNGIRVQIFMIVDFPGETLGDFNKSVAFLEQNHQFIDQVSVSRFGVLPDSEISHNPQEYGIKLIKGKTGANYSYLYSPLPNSYRYENLRSVWNRLSNEKTAGSKRNYPLKIIVPYY
jgi:radical SAM superfamily enzyme YgiQ (UPF0313 family)